MNSKLSLDYIMEVSLEEEDINMNHKKSFQMGDYVKVEAFLIKEIDHLDENSRTYTQLSDHYGLSFSVYFRGSLII